MKHSAPLYWPILITVISMAPAQVPGTGALDIVLVVPNSINMRKVDPGRAIPGALDNFRASLPSGSRVGLVVYASGARLVTDLKSNPTPGPSAALEDSLKLIRYRSRLTNLSAGVERAIYELRENGRSDSERIVLIVSDGQSVSSTSASAAERTHWLLTELTDEAKATKARIFTIVLGDGADYRVPQTLAHATRGSYFRASGVGSLPEILQKTIHAFKPVAAPQSEAFPVPHTPARNSLPGWGSIITTIVLVIAVGGVVFYWRRSRSPVAESQQSIQHPDSDPPSMPGLRDHGAAALKTISDAAEMLRSTEDQLKRLQAVATEYVTNADRSVDAAEDRHMSLIRDCISALDFLEVMAQQETLSAETSSALRKARKRIMTVLENARITEISVACGSPFDSSTQEYGSSEDRGEPYDVVSKIERKGYMMMLPSADSVVLRPARVEVSCRPVKH